MAKKEKYLASWAPSPPHRDGERRYAVVNIGEVAQMATNEGVYPDLRLHDLPGKGKKVSVEVKLREL